MKNLFYLSLLTVLVFNSIYSQAQIGIQVGPSISNMNINGDGDLLNKPSAFIGLRTGIEYAHTINNRFAIQTGIYYNQTGFTVTQGLDFEFYNIDIPANVYATTKMHFIELPLLLQANFGNESVRFFLQAGPQVSYAVDADLQLRARLLLDFTLGNYDINMKNNNFRQLELAGVLGAGIKVRMNEHLEFQAGIQYMAGFTDLTYEPVLDLSTTRYSFNSGIGLNYKF